MDNGFSGQLGVNYISTLGNLVLGMQFTPSNDPDNPRYYPVSCGPGSQGGSITGAGARYRHKGESKWPTK